jgi:hypothetical protein
MRKRRDGTASKMIKSTGQGNRDGRETRAETPHQSRQLKSCSRHHLRRRHLVSSCRMLTCHHSRAVVRSVEQTFSGRTLAARDASIRFHSTKSWEGTLRSVATTNAELTYLRTPSIVTCAKRARLHDKKYYTHKQGRQQSILGESCAPTLSFISNRTLLITCCLLIQVSLASGHPTTSCLRDNGSPGSSGVRFNSHVCRRTHSDGCFRNSTLD